MRRLTLIMAMTLVGCGSLVPQERTDNQSTRSAQAIANRQAMTVESTAKIPSTPSVSVDLNLPLGPFGEPTFTNSTSVQRSATPLGQRVQMPEAPGKPPSSLALRVAVPAAGEQRNSTSSKGGTDAKLDESFWGNVSTTLPLGSKLILLAIGLGLLWFLWQRARKSSATVNAISTVADNGFANAVTLLEHEASSAVPEIAGKFQAIAKVVEKARGKVKSI